MKISIIAFTENGMEIASRLTESLDGAQSNRCAKGGLHQWTEEHFSTSDALVFVGAIGIAIRAIAPHVQSKVRDPAVIVVDELGQYSIPVLSGHIGGANELAIQIAEILNAIPVVTTATDINNVFAIDTWAKAQGLRILNPECIKLVSSKLLRGESVRIKSDYPIKGDLPQNIILIDSLKDESNLNKDSDNHLDNDLDNDLDNISDNDLNNDFDNDFDVIISHRYYERNDDYKNTLFLIPQIITVGIGCRKDKEFESIEKSILNALENEKISILALDSIASIDKKADEKGIIEFAEKYDLPFNTFSAEELNGLKGEFTKSEFVRSVVEVDNVCERSAVMESGGKLIRRKDAHDGVTVALAIGDVDLSW